MPQHDLKRGINIKLRTNKKWRFAFNVIVDCAPKPFTVNQCTMCNDQSWQARYTAWHMATKTWPYKVAHMGDMVCSTNSAVYAFVTTFTDMKNGRVKVTNIKVNAADVDCNVALSKLF